MNSTWSFFGLDRDYHTSLIPYHVRLKLFENYVKTQERKNQTEMSTGQMQIIFPPLSTSKSSGLKADCSQ